MIVNEVVRRDLKADNEFYVTTNLKLTAVFEPSDGSAHAVLFIDSNGKLISSSYVLDNKNITNFPDVSHFNNLIILLVLHLERSRWKSCCF